MMNWGDPQINAFIIHFGIKLVRIAPHFTLTYSYSRFLPKAQLYFNFMTRTTKSKPYILTLPKYTVLIHCWIEYAISLLCWSTPCFITILSYTQKFHIAELKLILTHCWGIPYLITLLSISQVKYIAELYPILTYCLGVPNFVTLLR